MVAPMSCAGHAVSGGAGMQETCRAVAWKQSDGVFVPTGGDEAVEKILPAVIDYGMPVVLRVGC